jgi:hypothetical protein
MDSTIYKWWSLVHYNHWGMVWNYNFAHYLNFKSFKKIAIYVTIMVSSGMLHRVALVRTDVSEEPSASFIRVTRIGKLGTTLAATSIFLRSVHRLLVTASVVPSSPILVTLMKTALGSSETSVLTRATRRNIPEDTILHSHRRENLKSYICNKIPTWQNKR